MAGNSRDIVYRTVFEAKNAPPFTMVNLIAKVAEFSIIKKSNGGTDYFLVVKIVDRSCPAQGLAVNVFAPNANNLPNIDSAGSTIVCFHQVQVKKHFDETYCCFVKRKSSFALYNGNPTDIRLDPYQASADYQTAAHLSEILVQLRKFLPKKHPYDGTITSLSYLRNIKNNEHCDIICKVLHICEKSRDELMVFIWDGTDAPPAALETKLDMEMNQPTPLHLEPAPLSQEILDSFPRFGTVLRITANKSFFGEFQNLHNAGRWTKLVNVSCSLESGIWTGKMDKDLFKSRVFIFPDEDGVKYRKRAYVQRTECTMEQTPLTSFPQSAHLTVIEDDHLPYMTLIDSITNPKMEHVFKCIVRVVASCPWRGENLRSPPGSDNRRLYRGRLTLEDPTARIHAYILHGEGVKFFGDNLTSAELSMKMMKLHGIKDLSDVLKTRNPPWIWCCLSSYCMDPQPDDQGGRRGYFVFKTQLTD